MTETRLTTSGRFETENASKYLQQLCKHFAHKVEVDYDADRGTVQFGIGTAELAAQEQALMITVSAENAEGIGQAKSVIDSHLARFAFRENFEQMDWADAA